MEYIGFVYLWTNKINGKGYIGLHVGKVDDGYIGSGTYFVKAVKKYGVENFDRKILYFETESVQNLYQKEYEYINQFNAVLSEDFYNQVNISPNAFKWVEGNLVIGPRSQEFRDKIRMSKLGKKLSEKARESLKRSSYSKGKHYYNDGISEGRYAEDQVPDGWKRGRLVGKVPSPGEGSVWYTDGTIDKRFYDGEEIPEGWVKGRSKQNVVTKDKTTGRFSKKEAL